MQRSDLRTTGTYASGGCRAGADALHSRQRGAWSDRHKGARGPSSCGRRDRQGLRYFSVQEDLAVFFREVLNEDLDCASYMVADGDVAVVIDPKWEVEAYLQQQRRMA